MIKTRITYYDKSNSVITEIEEEYTNQDIFELLKDTLYDARKNPPANAHTFLIEIVKLGVIKHNEVYNIVK